MTLRVGVIGVAGRLGSVLAAGIAAADDLELVAGVSPAHAGRTLADVLPALAGDTAAAEVTISASLDALTEASVDVAVEVTGPATVGAHLRWLLEHDVHAVVGATGVSEEDVAAAERLIAASSVRALIVPNFSIGAVLVERFAAEAAQYLPHVEIVELHHDRKVDAPSGTAIATAAAIAAGRDGALPAPAGVDGPAVAAGSRGAVVHGVPIHAVRLPGLVAHEEVLLGGEGQLVTLRHDTTDRTAFVPGALLACRRVAGLDGLTVGLGPLL